MVRALSNHVDLAFDLTGGNPRNANDSLGSPDTARAAITALGPGIGSIRIPASIAALISRCPGSDIVGVPASDTSATLSPRSSRPTSDADFCASLCS